MDIGVLETGILRVKYAALSVGTELYYTSTTVKAWVQEEHDLARGQSRMWALGRSPVLG